ncbi:hypothetical protein Gotur_030723 [Gossypium turneri]
MEKLREFWPEEREKNRRQNFFGNGARELMCFRVIGASNHRSAHIGDFIVAVIKEAVPKTPLERSKVIRAVIDSF